MKKILELKLREVEKVNAFCKLATQSPCDITCYSERYIVNGKSILGLYSLNLLKPITAEVEGEDSDVDVFINSISNL